MEINLPILVLLGAAVALLMVVFVVTFLNIAQKRHFKYKQNMKEIKAKYDTELLQSQIEVQNNALQQISEEIHDNVGQLLSIVKFNLSAMEKQATYNGELVDSTKQILIDIISETRDLSKSLSVRTIKEQGLSKAIEQQLNRLARSGKILTNFKVEGTLSPLNSDEEIIVFRIVQESLQNAIKHSDCQNLSVYINRNINNFILEITDDGKGFELAKSGENSGQGIGNLKHKAQILNAALILQSEKDKGTTIKLAIHKQNE